MTFCVPGQVFSKPPFWMPRRPWGRGWGVQEWREKKYFRGNGFELVGFCCILHRKKSFLVNYQVLIDADYKQSHSLLRDSRTRRKRKHVWHLHASSHPCAANPQGRWFRTCSPFLPDKHFCTSNRQNKLLQVLYPESNLTSPPWVERADVLTLQVFYMASNLNFIFYTCKSILYKCIFIPRQ